MFGALDTPIQDNLRVIYNSTPDFCNFLSILIWIFGEEFMQMENN